MIIWYFKKAIIVNTKKKRLIKKRILVNRGKYKKDTWA